MLVGLGLMMEIGHDKGLGLTGQIMLCGEGRNRKGFKNLWQAQPQVCCQHWGSGKKECRELWEMLLQTVLPQCP